MGNIIQPPIPLEKLLFLRACTLNNLPEVKSLLAGGADVNWRWRNNGGWSGLHLAAVHNYQELLELLLAQPNLDVNISAQWIKSAGHPASEGENPHTEVYNQMRIKEV